MMRRMFLHGAGCRLDVPRLCQVAEDCTEDDVEIWVWNHAKAELSVEQAEASRALSRKDHVDPLIKEGLSIGCQYSKH